MVALPAVALYSAVLVMIGFFGQYPHHIARWSVELKAKKWYASALVLRHSYTWVSLLYRVLHLAPPAHVYDRAARLVWSQDLSIVPDYLVQKTTETVTWDKHQTQFLEMYSNIYGKLHDKSALPEKLGNAGVDWVKLGFQGKDPSTDFRGTGTLGFLHFDAFTKAPGAIQVFVQSGSYTGINGFPNDAPWYPVALVSIRLTNYLAQKMLGSPLCTALIWEGSQATKTTFAEQITKYHTELMFSFHAKWQERVEKKELTSFLENEAFIKHFELAVDRQICSKR